MKVIVAGGRYYNLTEEDKKYLLSKVKDETITTLICGMASGVDIQTYNLLKEVVPCEEYPALWDDLSVIPCNIKYTKQRKPYNSLAGPNRNAKMAENAEAVILFPGGTGTDNMYKQSKKYGLKIIKDMREILF